MLKYASCFIHFEAVSCLFHRYCQRLFEKRSLSRSRVGSLRLYPHHKCRHAGDAHSRSQMIADLYPKVGAFETIVEGWRSWSHCRRHLFRRGGLTVQDSLSRTSRRLRSCSSFGDPAVCSLIAQLENLQQVKDLSRRDPNIIQMWDPLKKARHVRASAVFVMWKSFVGSPLLFPLAGQHWQLMAANVLSFLLQADVTSIRHGTTPLQHNYFFHKKTGRSAWTMEVPKRSKKQMSKGKQFSEDRGNSLSVWSARTCHRILDAIRNETIRNQHLNLDI